MGPFASATQLLRGGMAELLRPGESTLRGNELLWVGRFTVTFAIVVTNLVGACAVLVIAAFVIPMPTPAHLSHVRLVNGLAAAAYVAVAIPLGVALGVRGMLRLRKWLREERPPSPTDVRIVLRAPLRLFVLQVSLWTIAAVLFALLNLRYSAGISERVAVLVLLTGLVTASCAYLLTELLLRPAAARALGHRGLPERLVVPGVATRLILAWALGTGIPVLGLVAIGILALAGDRGITPHVLGVAMVVLGGVGIAVGLLAVTVASRATADPVDSVRRALERVKRGDFDAHVPVYDGTQIGQLQLGFNQMVAGLAEREQIREAFGRYVDPEVARHILSEGIDFAGEQVEVTIMFIDVRDFTSYAERMPPSGMVAALNELFEKVVPIVHEHGGRIDKFIGDGVLAVFGAPRRQPDHADQALAAALQIAEAVSGSDSELQIGIGLSSGAVVAGNLGADGRLEFTVIGDAVNVAARIEAATRETGDTILIAERTKELLRAEHPSLLERSGLELRGKREAVRVYAVG